MRRRHLLAIAALLCAIILPSFGLVESVVSASGITIDTVLIGDPGNPNHFTFGRVDNAYRLGKYEVTVGQYTAFLNAVAATDTYRLYNPNMAMDLNIAGIAQNGSPGNYTYSVIGSPNHPVTYVSSGDALRFANWLHNDQPTGSQDGSTTEDGAYVLNGAISDVALTFVSRQANAKWYIPGHDEWYKAAYYQPRAQGGDIDSYWTYPMRTNSVPYSDQPPGATPNNSRVANFFNNDRTANGYNDGYAVTDSTSLSSSQNYLTDVGAYISSPSYYGTFDQGGNVREWIEAASNAAGLFLRAVRGGSWLDSASFLSHGGPMINVALERSDVGFRVGTIFIPEPSTAVLAASVVVALFASGRHRRM